MKKLTEQQELYISMVDEETSKKIDQLKVRKDAKNNIKLVYGFMKSVSNRFSIDTLLKQKKHFGKEWFRYQLVSNGVVFSFGYDTLSKETCIKSYDTLSRIIRLLDNQNIVKCNFGKDVDWFDAKCISNSNSNGNSNSIFDSISTDNISIDNKTNLKNNNIILLFKSLIKENKKMNEQIEELTEQMELIIDKVNKLEDYTIEQLNGIKQQVDELSNARTEQPTMNAGINQSKSNRQSFWDSWNRFMDAIYSGDVENKEHHYQTYINKVKTLYQDPTQALQGMEKQYTSATSNKSNNSNSNFVVKDDWKVYFHISELGYKDSIGLALQEINNNLSLKIPNEQTEQAKNYYFNCLKKAYQCAYTEEQLKSMFNRFVPNFQLINHCTGSGGGRGTKQAV